MEEIKIYHSLWKNAKQILFCIAFTALGVYVIAKGAQGKTLFWAWTSIIFFGCGGLIIIYDLLMQHITHQPYMLITNEYVRVNVTHKKKIEIFKKRNFSVLANFFAKFKIAVCFLAADSVVNVTSADFNSEFFRKRRKKVKKAQRILAAGEGNKDPIVFFNEVAVFQMRKKSIPEKHIILREPHQSAFPRYRNGCTVHPIPD